MGELRWATAPRQCNRPTVEQTARTCSVIKAAALSHWHTANDGCCDAVAVQGVHCSHQQALSVSRQFGRRADAVRRRHLLLVAAAVQVWCWWLMIV